MINYEHPQMKYAEQKGLISIICPIYNVDESYLRECLDSILAQTFKNWEAILVDDGSMSSIGKIIDEYAEKDSRFLAIHKQNGGTLLARKTGLENSRGEFIANIDSDDAYDSQFLEKMYAKIIQTDVDFVWCKNQITDKNSILHITDYKWNTDISENVTMTLTPAWGISLVTWDKLVRRETYIKINFPVIYLNWGEDPVHILQIAYHSKSAAFISENLYFYRSLGITSYTSSLKPIDLVRGMDNINKVLEILFLKNVPQNVKNAFLCRFRRMPYYYYKLNKKQKQEFKKELKHLLSDYVKMEKNLILKICLFLANKGVEFPYKWIVDIIKFIGKITK